MMLKFPCASNMAATDIPSLFPDKYSISLAKKIQNVRSGSSFSHELQAVLSTCSLR